MNCGRAQSQYIMDLSLGKVFKKNDLTNYLVLPKTVTSHGDASERHLTPLPTASFPISSYLYATDADAVSNGIRTAFMAHSWSWEGGYRSLDHVFFRNL